MSIRNDNTKYNYPHHVLISLCIICVAYIAKFGSEVYYMDHWYDRLYCIYTAL